MAGPLRFPDSLPADATTAAPLQNDDLGEGGLRGSSVWSDDDEGVPMVVRRRSSTRVSSSALLPPPPGQLSSEPELLEVRLEPEEAQIVRRGGGGASQFDPKMKSPYAP